MYYQFSTKCVTRISHKKNNNNNNNNLELVERDARVEKPYMLSVSSATLTYTHSCAVHKGLLNKC